MLPITGPSRVEISARDCRVELDPIDSDCQLYPDPISALVDLSELEGVKIFPNPVEDQLFLKNDLTQTINLKINDLAGREIYIFETLENQLLIHTDHWMPGLYILRIMSLESQQMAVQKIIKY